MGDRITLQFVRGKDYSDVVYSQWGGTSIIKDAVRFAIKMKKYKFSPQKALEEFIKLRDEEEGNQIWKNGEYSENDLGTFDHDHEYINLD